MLIQAGDAWALAANILKQKFTKRKITTSAASYRRGVPVDIRPGDEGPLAFERSRVVIHLEGRLPSEAITATMRQQNRRFVCHLLPPVFRGPQFVRSQGRNWHTPWTGRVRGACAGRSQHPAGRAAASRGPAPPVNVCPCLNL
ncbi:MAG TPA: hypothetical protein VFA54_07520 [Bryobacterales bacterium]|jgi:hypothetical protein|nr:hypothetical protein [Bryobacterales bacterium]